MYNYFISNIDEKWWNWKTTDFTMEDVCLGLTDENSIPEKQGDFVNSLAGDALLAAFMELIDCKEVRIYNRKTKEYEYVPDFADLYIEEPWLEYLDNLYDRVIYNSDNGTKIPKDLKLRDFDLKEDLLSFLDNYMDEYIFSWDNFEKYATLYLVVAKGIYTNAVDDAMIRKLAKKYGWETHK